MTTLAPKLPWSHAHSGGFPRLGGQALPTDADAIDYLNRVKAADGGVGVEVGVAQAIDAFVKGCKADNAGYAGDPTRTNWDALQACCIMAGARTISGALVPLKGVAPTAQGGWTSNEYSRGGSAPGLKGNGSTLYLDSNRAANADVVDDHHACFCKTQLGASYDAAGVRYLGGADRKTGYATRFKVIGNGDMFSGSNAALTTWTGSPVGFYGFSRSSSSAAQYKHPSGSGVNSVASLPEAPYDSSNVFVFCRSDTPAVPSEFTDARISFYSIGSACDLAALDSRTTHLMNSIRFTLLTGLNPGDYDPATLAYLLAAYTAGGSLA